MMEVTSVSGLDGAKLNGFRCEAPEREQFHPAWPRRSTANVLSKRLVELQPPCSGGHWLFNSLRYRRPRPEIV